MQQTTIAGIAEAPATDRPAPPGTPIGKNKPEKPAMAPIDINKERRRLIWACIWGYLGVNFLMFLRFFFPRALYEPNTIVNIGFPASFQLGVNQQDFVILADDAIIELNVADDTAADLVSRSLVNSIPK